MPYRLLLALVALATSALVWSGVPHSGATFTAGSTSTGTVGASLDWTAPTVSLRDPGSPLQGVVTLTADASDSGLGLDRVAIEALPAGGAWTTVCTDTTAPYTCSWDTRTVADGSWALRARATDRAGYVTVSAQVSTVVANNLLVVLTDPGSVLRGSVPLTARAFNTGILALTIRIEYAVAESGTWKTACTGLGATLTCSWASTGVSSQEYDFRAVAVVGTTTSTSAVIADVLVDNTAPTVTLTDPGTPLRGTVTLAATAADTHSGIASVAFQYAATGSSTWATACTASEAATCRFDTTALADGGYSFRAVATDVAGNSTTSAVVAGRTVDNSVTAVSVEDPGAFLSGTVTVHANASSTAGISSVRLQRAVTGTSTWVDLCTDAAAPYACSWNTTTVADGSYDLRAVATDGRGGVTTSALVTARRVDNSPLRGLDVQAVNGGISAGRLDAGDQIAFSYSALVNPASVSAGWTGSSLPVTLRLRDGGLLGLGARGDSIDVLRNGAAVNLGSVNLRHEYAKTNKTITFNATMVATTVTVNGAPTTVVTVTLGTLAGGNGLRGGNPASMVWTPSALATDPSGRACAVTPVTETGAVDRDF